MQRFVQYLCPCEDRTAWGETQTPENKTTKTTRNSKLTSSEIPCTVWLNRNVLIAFGFDQGQLWRNNSIFNSFCWQLGPERVTLMQSCHPFVRFSFAQCTQQNEQRTILSHFCKSISCENVKRKTSYQLPMDVNQYFSLIFQNVQHASHIIRRMSTEYL